MKAKITFLGTGQAIPTKSRNHTGILLSYGSENILVDCGEGIQRQFRIAGINPCNLTRLFITHWHGDHVLGIPGLFQSLVMNHYHKTLQVYGPIKTSEYIHELLRLFAIRTDLKLQVHEIGPGKIVEEKDFFVEAEEMNHGVPCLAYKFVEKEKRRINKEKLQKLRISGSPLLKQLQQGKDVEIAGRRLKADELTYIENGKSIVFILDTAVNRNMLKIARNTELLVCESTYTSKEEDKAKEYQHMTAAQAASAAKEAGVKKLMLTHISQRYEGKEKQILKEARKIFENTIIAKDFDEVEV